MTSVWTFIICIFVTIGSCQTETCHDGVLYFGNMYSITPKYTLDGKIATCQKEMVEPDKDVKKIKPTQG